MSLAGGNTVGGVHRFDTDSEIELTGSPQPLLKALNKKHKDIETLEIHEI